MPSVRRGAGVPVGGAGAPRSVRGRVPRVPGVRGAPGARPALARGGVLRGVRPAALEPRRGAVPPELLGLLPPPGAARRRAGRRPAAGTRLRRRVRAVHPDAPRRRPGRLDLRPARRLPVLRPRPAAHRTGRRAGRVGGRGHRVRGVRAPDRPGRGRGIGPPGAQAGRGSPPLDRAVRAGRPRPGLALPVLRRRPARPVLDPEGAAGVRRAARVPERRLFPGRSVPLRRPDPAPRGRFGCATASGGRPVRGRRLPGRGDRPVAGESRPGCGDRTPVEVEPAGEGEG